jgi:pimeloyl-ACP methyl ester carboxylesterase
MQRNKAGDTSKIAPAMRTGSGWACAMLMLLALTSACSIRHVQPFQSRATPSECVILLHGLIRSSASLNRMRDYLSEAGYQVENWSYPSRRQPIEQLSYGSVPVAAERCRSRGGRRINFVTHSLGGILVRYYLAQEPIPNLGRVVMISPPNQGSELVDFWSGMPGYSALNGPVGFQLGTDANSIPLQLGVANFEVGIIAGNHTTNLLFSLLIPGDDDGKVSVEGTKLGGMSDFIVVPEAHSLIMRDPEVMRQVVYFLNTGHFHRAASPDTRQ